MLDRWYGRISRRRKLQQDVGKWKYIVTKALLYIDEVKLGSLLALAELPKERTTNHHVRQVVRLAVEHVLKNASKHRLLTNYKKLKKQQFLYPF